jgi:hypothetical protein
MAPPSATTTETQVTKPSNGFNHAPAQPNGTAPNELKLLDNLAKAQLQNFPAPPKFEDTYEEREYLKGRLALAFRIFGKLGFDEGVAGHITLRDPVCIPPFFSNPLTHPQGRPDNFLGEPLRHRLLPRQKIRPYPS